MAFPILGIIFSCFIFMHIFWNGTTKLIGMTKCPTIGPNQNGDLNRLDNYVSNRSKVAFGKSFPTSISLKTDPNGWLGAVDCLVNVYSSHHLDQQYDIFHMFEKVTKEDISIRWKHLKWEEIFSYFWGKFALTSFILGPFFKGPHYRSALSISRNRRKTN